jgi:hypothetical protein
MILGSVLFVLNRAVTSYQNRSTRFRDGEIAYYAARSGLTLAERILEGVAGRPGRQAGNLRDLYDLMVSSRPEDLNGSEDEITLPFAERLLPETVEGEVEAVVRFRNVASLLRNLPPGYLPDPREKRGILELECRAQVGAAERRLIVRRDFHVMGAQLPVVGRFSLLLGELLGGQNFVNALTYSPKLGLFLRSVSRKVAWPLQVYPLPVDTEEDLAPPAQRFATDPLRPLKEGGWVGLFGATPWVMNVCFGSGSGSPSEQGYLLRNFESVVPSTHFTGLYEKVTRLGYTRDITRLPMFAAYESETIPDGASLLQLAGDSRYRTPPVVLGRAFRRFLSFSKLGTTADGDFTSFHGVAETDFEAARMAFQNIVPGGDYASYQNIMARSVVEPFNRSYDFVVTDAETLDEEGRVLPGATPWSPGRFLQASEIAPYLQPIGSGPENFLYPDPTRREEEKRSGGIVLGTEEGESFYQGHPADILPGLRELALARSLAEVRRTATLSAEDEFKRRFLVDSKLDLGLPLHLQSQRLTLGPLHVLHGGTLAVDGDIEVAGPLTTARGEILTLVSLNGSIRVRNEAPIAASLIACQGQVLPSSRGLDVRGQIVAAQFDVASWLEGTGARRIVYDPRLNPALRENQNAQYRILIGGERRVVFRRQ